MRSAKRTARAVLVSLVLLAVSLGLSASAFGWTGVRNGNTVTITRDLATTSTDASTTVTVCVYYDYRGGSTWNTTYAPHVSTSYQNLTPQITMGMQSGAGMEVDLVPGYRCQLVWVSAISPNQKRGFAVLADDEMVSIVNTPTVSIVNTPTVNITGSTTITGTVSVSRIDSMPVSSAPESVSVTVTAPPGGWTESDSGTLDTLSFGALSGVLLLSTVAGLKLGGV